MVHNFLWHERFTWADRAGAGVGRFLKFNLTTGILSIAGNLALMKLLVGVAHFNYLVANGITIAACSIFNFLVSDGFVFAAAGGKSVHVIVHLAFDRPDIFRLVFEGIHMHHPAKDVRSKNAARSFAILFG